MTPDGTSAALPWPTDKDGKPIYGPKTFESTGTQWLGRPQDPSHVSAAANSGVERRPLCPWCKTPGYEDDPYCLYCGRTRAEAREEAKSRGK